MRVILAPLCGVCVMSYYRTLKNPSKSPALGSRLEKKQETSENSSQMLMFLRGVCSSRWTERICL